MMKKTLVLLLCLALTAGTMSACGTTERTPDSVAETVAETDAATDVETETETVTDAETTPVDDDSDAEQDGDAEDDEENYNTGDASLDNIRNQDDIGDNELLVISFGTSFNDSRRLTIGAIEDSLETAFPDYAVRRGFTANIVIDHVERRDGMRIDDVTDALNRAADNGVKKLVVQPTHLMDGLEYNDVVDEIAQYSDAFEQVAIGEPLLTSDEDFARVEAAIVHWTKEYDDGETAICFMGHGTEAESNAVYQKLQGMLTEDGHTNYYIGTVEAAPTVEDVLAAVQAGEYKRVVLEPLMVVSGDHANNDMAGDEEDSWRTIFENAGYEVVCLLRGLGENEDIRQIYVEHAQAAMDSLD